MQWEGGGWEGAGVREGVGGEVGMFEGRKGWYVGEEGGRTGMGGEGGRGQV